MLRIGKYQKKPAGNWAILTSVAANPKAQRGVQLPKCAITWAEFQMENHRSPGETQGTQLVYISLWYLKHKLKHSKIINQVDKFLILSCRDDKEDRRGEFLDA